MFIIFRFFFFSSTNQRKEKQERTNQKNKQTNMEDRYFEHHEEDAKSLFHFSLYTLTLFLLAILYFLQHLTFFSIQLLISFVQFLKFYCQIFVLKFRQILFNFFCWFIKFLWNRLMICSYNESDWFKTCFFF